MNISVIGAGYVGLVTGACLAERGHHVTCVDLVPERVAAITSGVASLHEPGLPELLGRAVAAGRLTATTDLRAAVTASSLTFVAVGTPSTEHGIDYTAFDAAVDAVGDAMAAKREWHTLVVKSTVVPTTTDTRVRARLDARRSSGLTEYGLGMNPEFLREGCAVADFMDPDRIVIGAVNDRSFEAIRSVYDAFTAPIVRTTPRMAEMIKYASNALLASLISFSNELAAICEAVPEMDIAEVMSGVHLDRRLSPRLHGEIVRPGILTYLQAGCGFGGSCFPKDLKALEQFGRSLQVSTPIVSGALAVNRGQPARVVRMTEAALGGLTGRRIALLGLTFKPDTDDLRESPALTIARELAAGGAEVRAVDPVGLAAALAGPLAGTGVRPAASAFEALEGADAAVLATAWREFVRLRPADFASRMRQPIVIDGRRVFARADMEAAGVRYLGIGYGSLAAALA